MGDGLLALGAPLLDELLRRQLRLRELLRLLPGLALLVGDNLKVAKVKTWSIFTICRRVCGEKKIEPQALANVFVASVLVSTFFQLRFNNSWL